MGTHLYIVDVKKVVNTTISDATVETVIQGPQNALSENINININLIRQLYYRSSLKLEEQKLNTCTRNRLVLLYDEELVDPDVLKRLKRRLEQIQDPELFRVQLALSISGSRAEVPYPSYIEVLIMLIMMEPLTEASIRLPQKHWIHCKSYYYHTPLAYSY